MGMDSQLSSVRRSSEIEECVIIREYAQRERDDAQASNRERKRLLLFFSSCVADVLLEERHDHYGSLLSLSIPLYTRQ